MAAKAPGMHDCAHQLLLSFFYPEWLESRVANLHTEEFALWECTQVTCDVLEMTVSLVGCLCSISACSLQPLCQSFCCIATLPTARCTCLHCGQQVVHALRQLASAPA